MNCATLPIGNPYSITHPGIDYDVPIGTPIYAPHTGSVHTLKWNYSYGFHIYLHVGVWTFLYAHLSVISVPDSYGVKVGTLLGLTGNTGHSTGPHLHYEVRFAGTPVDPSTMPCPFIPSAKESTFPQAPTQAQSTAYSIAAIKAGAVTGLPSQQYLALGFTANGIQRKYGSRCMPPSGGGFWSHIPIVSQGQAVVKDTSYAICVLTDVDTYIRLVMIIFGALLLVRGVIDFSKVLSPAFGAKLQSAHDAGLAAVKTAAAA